MPESSSTRALTGDHLCFVGEGPVRDGLALLAFPPPLHNPSGITTRRNSHGLDPMT